MYIFFVNPWNVVDSSQDLKNKYIWIICSNLNCKIPKYILHFVSYFFRLALDYQINITYSVLTAFLCMMATKTTQTQPAPAVVPPAGASPPSSSSASGSPAVCVCGRCALFHILLHKSASASTRHRQDRESIATVLSRCLGTARCCCHLVVQYTSPFKLSSGQIFPWQQWFDISSALITSEMGAFLVAVLKRAAHLTSKCLQLLF